MLHLQRNPDKLEAKALDYERKGKTNKAIKYREKAARLRTTAGGYNNAGQLGLGGSHSSTTTTVIRPGGVAAIQQPIGARVPGAGVPLTTAYTPRTPATYEANALKWEQRGNWTKAQKNREKVWRLRNPQHSAAPAPAFYNSNKFLGYDLQPGLVTTLPTVQGLTPLVPLGAHGHGLPPLAGQGLVGQGLVGQGVSPYGGQAYGGQAYGGQAYGGQGYGAGGLRPGRDPARLEARAAELEARGKAQKALRYRNKAAQLRTGSYVSRRTPQLYETNALKWEKRGKYDKAQKNRAKAWRLKYPQYNQHVGPSFYNNGAFSGYDVPFTPSDSTLLPSYRSVTTTSYPGGIQSGIQTPFVGQGLVGQGLVGQGLVGQGVSPYGGQGYGGQGYGAGSHLGGLRPGRDPARLEARAAELEARGKAQKALRYRTKAAQLRSNTYVSRRTPQLYETNALKWEQRGNYEKAQKNRAKAWRLQNPQYAQHVGPSFYNNKTFTGYNVPFTPSDSTLLPYYRSVTTTQSTYQGGVQSGIPLGYPVGGQSGLPIGAQGGAAHHGLLGLLPSRDPTRLEARAIAAEQKGKPQKALKLRERAARIRAGTHTPRTIQVMEAKALRWEQEGNWKRAQKQRTKIWRLQNPQYITSTTFPTFYNNNVFLGYNVPFTGASSVTSSMSQLHIGTQTIYHAPIVEQVVRPTIVTETQRAERIVEVQPIIHREVEAPTLKIIEQHIYETVPSIGPNTITNAAIIQETITPIITEELQPIVHREVPAPFIERVEQHVTEHIVQPVVQTREVVQDTTIHTVATGVPLLATSGVGLGTQQQVLVGSGVGIGAQQGVGFGAQQLVGSGVGIGGQQFVGVGGQQFVGGVQQTTTIGAPVVTEQTTITQTTTQPRPF